MLITPANLWGMLLAELKSICACIAPSSPLSLVTDHGWYPGPGLANDNLELRVALMVPLQTLFGLLALGLAASRLKRARRTPTGSTRLAANGPLVATTRSTGGSLNCRCVEAEARSSPSDYAMYGS